jgi:hypothetical protein
MTSVVFRFHSSLYRFFDSFTLALPLLPDATVAMLHYCDAHQLPWVCYLQHLLLVLARQPTAT